MENLKKAAVTLKMYPKLKLGERKQTGLNDKNEPKYSIFTTGPHKIKFTAEPTTTTVMKMGKPTKVFKCIVEENGQLYKWFVPIMNKDETEGHYLIERLKDIPVGEEIIVEMKRQGARNYIDVRREGDPNVTANDDEHEVDEEEGVIDYSDDPALKEE